MALINLHTLPGLNRMGGQNGFADFHKIAEFPEFPDFASAAQNIDPFSTPEVPGGPVDHFADILSEAIGAVDMQHREAEHLAVTAATGGDVDTHQIMIATAKAETMLHLSSSVATKSAQAFQTLMNMQI